MSEQWIEGESLEYRDGHWYQARALPYYAGIKEKIKHWLFKRHIYYGHPACLICGKQR